MEAHYERKRDYYREQTRSYRARNPEMMRESKRRRSAAKEPGKRLPRGTVKRLGEAQRWRCAACACDISSNYHLDHVMPLALGGRHEPGNLQLLCPPCNLCKSAKHPIDFMQQRGFLL